MSTSQMFGGRKIQLPGVYSRIVSGRQNPPLNLDYGTLLIIDNTALGTLTNNGIRGGAGITGAKTQGKNSIYEIRSLADFREFVGYGWWWKAADFLFRPSGSFPGISKVYIVKPATTIASLMTFTATGGGTAGGTFKVKTLDEGVAANGVLTSTKLTYGYAYTIETGIVDPAKWIFKIWRGKYKGLHSDSISYDEVSITTASESPDLLVKSPEFDNISTLIEWATSDPNFGSYFYLDSTSAVVGTGVVNQADITPLTGFQLSSGATSTYDQIDATLEAVKDLDYNFVMTTTASVVHSDTNVLKIKAHILTEAKYDKFLIAGGSDAVLEDSVTSAVSLNSDRVMLVHGAIKKVTQANAEGFRTWGSFYHACLTAGRLMGLPPQVPITAKSLAIDRLVDPLSETKQVRALEKGVMVSIYSSDRSEFINLQGINTLQNNSFQLNPDGTSFSIQLRRIAAQLNKELIVNANLQLMNDPDGVNRNTLSETDLREWVKGYLSRKLATDTEDNLILSFQNVTVTRDQDAYFCTYEFVPNGEINKIFLTGFML